LQEREHTQDNALNMLIQMPNVICTPQTAWFSVDSCKEVRVAAAKEIRRALMGQMPEGLINCVNKQELITSLSSAVRRNGQTAAAAMNNLLPAVSALNPLAGMSPFGHNIPESLMGLPVGNNLNQLSYSNLLMSLNPQMLMNPTSAASAVMSANVRRTGTASPSTNTSSVGVSSAPSLTFGTSGGMTRTSPKQSTMSVDSFAAAMAAAAAGINPGNANVENALNSARSTSASPAVHSKAGVSSPGHNILPQHQQNGGGDRSRTSSVTPKFLSGVSPNESNGLSNGHETVDEALAEVKEEPDNDTPLEENDNEPPSAEGEEADGVDDEKAVEKQNMDVTASA
jgi:hypothetical protein